MKTVVLFLALLVTTPALAGGRTWRGQSQCSSPSGYVGYAGYGGYGNPYGAAAYYGGFSGYAWRPGVPAPFCPEFAPPLYYVPPTYGNVQAYYTPYVPPR